MRGLRRDVSRGLVLGWANLFAACDKGQHLESADTGCRMGEAVAELGTGLDAFEALAEGADLPFFLGPQGGYHVFAAVRARGLTPGPADNPFDPNNPMVSFDLIYLGAPIDGFVPQPRHLDPVADGWEQILGQVVVIGLPNPLELEGQTVTLTASLTDRCGVTVTDERDVVLRLASTF